MTDLYKNLRSILDDAFDQAAKGKGKERHSRGQSFDEQPMQRISDLLGTANGLLFQAIKKAQESVRLPDVEAEKELLGAINYIAGAILYRRQNGAQKQDGEPEDEAAENELNRLRARQEAMRPDPLLLGEFPRLKCANCGTHLHAHERECPICESEDNVNPRA